MAKPYFYVQIFINQIGFTKYPGVLSISTNLSDSCQIQKIHIFYAMKVLCFFVVKHI